MTKKLLILGGSRYIIPVIKKAHELGIYVITCDYLPDNAAHQYSDEYINVSIIDKEQVLEAAQKLNIDGVISFACDPGVVTAAYVAEKMGLPFQGSYESTRILQDKGLFRQFLTDNGFNVPKAKRYSDINAPFEDIDFFNWPVIVKPTDSAGSKGVTRVDKPEDLPEAIRFAVENSHNSAFIIEDFLTFKGYHSSADPFTVDGKLEFVTYSDQLFDKEADNPYTPALIIWPSTIDQGFPGDASQPGVSRSLRRGRKPYLMEISPRGGGCKIAEIQELAMGAPFIENEIRSAVGMPLLDMNWHECDGCWCEMVVHARPGQQGILKEIRIDDEIKEKYLKLTDISAKPGDMILPFTGANMSLGDIFLRFDSREEMDRVVSSSNEWLHIILE